MANGHERDTEEAYLHSPPQPLAELSPSHDGLTAEQREAIFARRAAQLARPVTDLEGAASTLGGSVALVFPLDGERYAFAAEDVREVRARGEITPLPGTPAFVAGLANVRGRIVPILDLQRLFDLPRAAPSTADETLVILASPRGNVGVLASGPPVVRSLGDNLRALPPTAAPELQAPYVRGVTPDLVILLDAQRLLADKRVIIQVEL